MSKLEKYLPLFIDFAKVKNAINAAFLFGSFARKEERTNSDLDIALWINDDFCAITFLQELEAFFSSFLRKGILLLDKNKIALYFENGAKIDLLFAQNIENLALYYRGSNIPKSHIKDSILFDKTNMVYEKLLAFQVAENLPSDYKKYIDKFLYQFEAASIAHKRSDAYQFYFHYNLALHYAMQLYLIEKQEMDYLYLPKKFTSNLLQDDLREAFYNATPHLTKKTLNFANESKRKLLAFFYAIAEKLCTNKTEFLAHRDFCEWIYERDYWWNFRDISNANPKIKEDLIFRSCSLSLYENDEVVVDLLAHKNIKTIIDLRALREVESMPYSEAKIKDINYVLAPLDPWAQPDWFIAKNYTGSNPSIAYRFFCQACKMQINLIAKTILEQGKKGGVLIHCHAGKDRTGIIISLLHLLIDTPKEIIYKDYLDSEMDTQKGLIDILFEEVENTNGIVDYLLSCSLSMSEILALKNILIHDRN